MPRACVCVCVCVCVCARVCAGSKERALAGDARARAVAAAARCRLALQHHPSDDDDARHTHIRRNTAHLASSAPGPLVQKTARSRPTASLIASPTLPPGSAGAPMAGRARSLEVGALLRAGGGGLSMADPHGCHRSKRSLCFFFAIQCAATLSRRETLSTRNAWSATNSCFSRVFNAGRALTRRSIAWRASSMHASAASRRGARGTHPKAEQNSTPPRAPSAHNSQAPHNTAF